MGLSPVDVEQEPYTALKERNWEPIVLSHPKLPHKQYRLSQISDLGTLVERIDTRKRPYQPITVIRSLREYAAKTIPLLMRFHRDYIFPLGKRRLAFFFLCQMYLGISASLCNSFLSKTIVEVC
jgi:hypothetical protein